MRLDDQWRVILRKAWSARLLAVAVVLSAAEVLLPFVSDRFPRTVFAVLSLVVVCGALVARVVVQKGLDK